MERKEIGFNYGILVIILFAVVCFLTDYIIIDRNLNGSIVSSNGEVVEEVESVEPYTKEKNIKIDYNRDYVYDAGYHYSNKYKEYDYCNGETTYTHDGFDVLVCDKGSIRLSNLVVPYINIKSNDAYRVNRELKDLYNEYANLFDTFSEGLDDGNGGSLVLGYDSFVSDKVLSVVVIYGYQQTDVLYPDYKVYNFDLSSGNLLDYSELIELLDIDTDVVYSDVFSNISDNILGYDIIYNETVNEFNYSINSDNILCFVNDDGILEYIVNVYVFGGRGNIFYRFSSDKIINSEDN